MLIMDNPTTQFFLQLHAQDFNAISAAVEGLTQSQLWQATPEDVSVGNLTCHVIEMERFWIDWGFANQPFERDREFEFARHSDLAAAELIANLQARRQRTVDQIAACSQEQWDTVRTFHSDPFTGETILHWRIHHVGLHRGHIQAHARWLRRC